MSKRNYFRVKGTSAIKSKKYLKKLKPDLSKNQIELEEWFKKEEERIRKERNW